MRNASLAGMIVVVVLHGAVAHAQDAFEVRVSPLSAFVYPTKDATRYWDGVALTPVNDAQNDAARRAVERFAVGAIRSAATASPIGFAAAAGEAGVTLVNDATHAPDVYGVVTIDGRAIGQTTVRQDSIVPSWSGMTTTVRLTAQSVIQVEFWDKDINRDDEIGTCTWIGFSAHSTPYAMMASQCDGRVLRAEILVQPIAAAAPHAVALPPAPPAPPDDNSEPTRTGSARTGFVQVVTPGGWANVLDARGRPLGQTPVRIEMPTGHQRLRLIPFGTDAPIAVDVQVPPNGSTSVSVPVAPAN